jgi:hypothetical protein
VTDHRRLAVDLFNHVWTLLGSSRRTPEQDDEMIHAAHASRHHWSHAGTAINLARGEWQCSRVYAMLGRAEPALHHALRCRDYVEAADDAADWDLPFAYEALARAYLVAGDEGAARENAARARALAAGVAEDDDREHVLAELGDLPG